MLEADIKDIIRNYDLQADEGFLFCLFEAVSNSLYCCMENQYTKITVNITRQYAANEIYKDKDNNIISFIIIDNGIGFTDDNFEKFAKKIYKTNHDGGKGLGRIAFLKIFNNVNIESIFNIGDKTYKRNFVFDRESIKDNKIELSNNIENKTTVTFKNMKKEFQEYTKRNIDYFQEELLKHFYIFFYTLLNMINGSR